VTGGLLLESYQGHKGTAVHAALFLVIPMTFFLIIKAAGTWNLPLTFT